MVLRTQRRGLAAAITAIFCTAMTPSAVWAAPATYSRILDAYKAASGGAGWDIQRTLREEFTVTAYGLAGTRDCLEDLHSGRFECRDTLGWTTGADGYDGTHVWNKDRSGAVTLVQGGDGPPLAINQAYRVSGSWWRADRGGANITGLGERRVGSSPCQVLLITPRGGLPFEAWFANDSHLLVRIVEKQGPLTVATTFSDYRPIDGVRLPRKTVVDMGFGAEYSQILTLTRARLLGARSTSVYAPPKAILSDAEMTGGAAETRIPLRLINNHVFGPVRIDGKGPYDFLFDSAGGNLISTDVAHALGLRTEGGIPEYGTGKGVTQGQLARVGTVAIGHALMRNQIFDVAPLSALNAVEGTRMAGLVGYELLSRFVVRLDYAGGTITLIEPKHFAAATAGTPVSFRFHEHFPEVSGTFEGVPARFDIDTGARFELTLFRPFVEQYRLRASHPHGMEAVIGWGFGGASRAYVTRASEITIGPIKIHDVITDMSTEARGGFSSANHQGNIGGALLKRFIVTFDYPHRTIYLKAPRAPTPDTGVFDEAGMWINESARGFAIVDVTQGGPAAEAGLKPGDIIVAVDGRQAADLRLYALRQRLRDAAPGTRIVFRVTEGSAVKDVNVTLRELI